MKGSARESHAVRLSWKELPRATRASLERKLEGLYGRERDEEAFDYLVLDKQQALLLLVRRLEDLSLWEAVRRVENVYGEGGVGMSFQAWPFLESALREHRDFTRRFANHHNTTGGFFELRRKLGSLHFLYVDNGARQWAVHFDLYNPLASPLNAWRHLLHEKIRGEAAHWKAIRASVLA